MPAEEADLSRVNLLDLAPARIADWRETRDRVVLERPRPVGAGVRGRLAWLSWRLAPRRLRLDAIGSFVWKRLDGAAKISEVADEVRGQFGDRAEPVEERLGAYVRMLRREGLLVYPGWERRAPERTPPRRAAGPPAR